MQLNLATDLSLRTLIYLGQKGAPATIGEISQAFDIARTHLMKVVMALVAEGLVSSIRGRHGGILLARAPDEIRIGDVVQRMESSMALVVCMKDKADNHACPLLPQCRLRDVFGKARQSFLATLNEYTLADLLPVSIPPTTHYE